MDFIGPIITPIVESLIVPVKKHLGFLFSSTSYIRKMHTRLLALNGTAEDLRKKEMAYKENNFMIPTYVPIWLEQVEEINKEASRIPRVGNGCFSMKLKYKAGKESFYIIKNIEELENTKSKIEWTKKEIPLARVISSKIPSASGSTHDDDDGTKNIFGSRQSIFKDVLKSLDPDCKTQRVALCGLGGVGKTTMMEELKTVVENRKMFKWVFRVVIGKRSDLLAIQQEIAQSMGKPLSEGRVGPRADTLERRFVAISENGKNKILIILDDVWEKVELKYIGLKRPFLDGMKLLITSRYDKVCMEMGVEPSSIFRLVGLIKEEANVLFGEIASLPTGNDELQNLGEEIINKCGGLPLAIKTMALTLKGEPKKAWTDALVRLKHHDLEDLYDVMDDIFDMSYDKLKKDDKSIFILCGLFPDDFNIPMEDLMRYGWGLQLFAKIDSLKEARDRTERCVQNLMRANLLIESDQVGCVKMHDLARAFVLGNFLKFKQASILIHGNESEWPTRDMREYCERILIKCDGMYVFPQDFNYPSLSLLKLMNNHKLLKFPEDFYKRMEKIEVLAYDRMKYPPLPVSLQYSPNLRTLCLHSCSLFDKDISFLGDLINLEILSFAHCGIRKLPSTIGKLERLKLLDVNGCGNLSIDDGAFPNVGKLEELYMKTSTYKALCFTHANCEQLEMLSRELYALEIELHENILKPQNMSFEKLRRFRISIGCLLKEISVDGGYVFKNTLKLVINCSELQESKINELFSQTEDLHLSVKDMVRVEEVMKHPSQPSTFNNLTALYISDCEDMTHMFTVPVANGLKKLEILSILSLPSLVSLCDGDVDVIELPKLMELNLSGLPNFTSIFPDDNISATRPFLIKEVLVPKLSMLIIDSMEQLKQIWPCDVTADNDGKVSMLREIHVTECESLVNLFPINPMGVLSQLQVLTVKKCCSIEVIFNIDLGKIEKLNTSNNCLRMIEVVDLDELREVWRINDGNNFDVCVPGFLAVDSVVIGRCKKFKNVCTPTSALFEVKPLMEITIIDCEENYGRYDDDEACTFDKNVPFTSTQLIHTFHNLRHLRIQRSDHTVAFEIECPGIFDRELEITQQQQQSLLLFPNLETLCLENMKRLQYVWKCNNWNDFFIFQKHQPHYSFQNLIEIFVFWCDNLMYLFSPHLFRLLSSLKKINIAYCDLIDSVVYEEHEYDDEETMFLNLDFLGLDYLSSLRHIGGGVAKRATNEVNGEIKVGVRPWSLCQYSRCIKIDYCHTLSSVIPCYVAGEMQKLEEFEINSCQLVIEIFETNNHHLVDQRSDMITIPLPPPTRHELPNLKILRIFGCPKLKYIFTFSTLESLEKLETLEIEYCEALQVIVKEEYEETSSKVTKAFHRLKSIELRDLPNLAGFFLGMNVEFRFPALVYVMINNCPQMTVFTSSESIARKLKHIHTKLGKHNLECGLNFHHQSPLGSSNNSYVYSEESSLSFHNLVEMNLRSTHNLEKIIPSGELLKLQNLEKIHVSFCDNLEVFEVALEVENSEPQTIVSFPKLREMELSFLEKLKYIWKNNQWRTLEFPNLTRLVIKSCWKLEYVFTLSMVGSLMQLQELDIWRTNYMEAIIKEEEECDGKTGEIINFSCLKSLKLRYHPRLKGFYLGKNDLSLPSLNKLVIRECPQIRICTEGRSVTPMLELLKTDFGLFGPVQDINSFITTKNEEGFLFGKPASSDDDA